jgi:hypothetical protein
VITQVGYGEMESLSPGTIRNKMQQGSYVMFDDPLTQEEHDFIKKFNELFSGKEGPKMRIIYKPFNRIEYEDQGLIKEDFAPDLPDYKYSLGWKMTVPSAEETIKEDMSPRMKRVINKLLP